MSDVLTPSQEIINRANTPEVITDSKGRSLQVKVLRGAELSRFTRMCGAATMEGGTWFPLSLARAAVRAIDGTPILMPTNMNAVDNLWEVVDMDATEAVLIHIGATKEAEGPDASKNS